MLSICLITTTTAIFVFICLTLLRQNYLIIKILFVLNYLIYIISYLLTMLVNPGIPERKYYAKNIKNDNKTILLYCKKCNILVPKKFKISHCVDCNICVKEQDHHCPWTGKCIAKYNIKYFYIFVNSLLIFFLNIFITLYCGIFYQTKFRKTK